MLGNTSSRETLSSRLAILSIALPALSKGLVAPMPFALSSKALAMFCEIF